MTVGFRCNSTTDWSYDIQRTLTHGHDELCVLDADGRARHMTNVEMERARGFTSHWTREGIGGFYDRREVIGDAVAVPLFSWVGGELYRRLRHTQ